MEITIRMAVRDGIGTLTLCRPPLNILTRAMLSDIRATIGAWSDAPDVRVVLLAAEGRHFSAGADVAEHLPPEHRDLIPEFIDTVRAIAECRAPVVAAVQGKCLGGGFELVQAADVIVAGESASFGQPEIMLGVSPPAACALLPELCTPGLAAELVLTGDVVPAERAREGGIVHRVVPDERLGAEALELARRMTRHSGAALRSTKHALTAGRSARRADALARAGAIYVDELMRTEDAIEGLTAFMEKRTPQWKHR